MSQYRPVFQITGIILAAVTFYFSWRGIAVDDNYFKEKTTTAGHFEIFEANSISL